MEACTAFVLSQTTNCHQRREGKGTLSYLGDKVCRQRTKCSQKINGWKKQSNLGYTHIHTHSHTHTHTHTHTLGRKGNAAWVTLCIHMRSRIVIVRSKTQTVAKPISKMFADNVFPLFSTIACLHFASKILLNYFTVTFYPTTYTVVAKKRLWIFFNTGQVKNGTFVAKFTSHATKSSL